MRDRTLTTLDRIAAAAAGSEAEGAFAMDEEAFRLIYERTARPLWAYLSRVTGDARTADDLLQETYYRFLRARRSYESDDHCRHALFRIASNLAHDAHRRRKRAPLADAVALSDAVDDRGTSTSTADRAAARVDLSRAMAKLKPRERSLLWLAYALGASHLEIAASLGLTIGSVKQLLLRARRRLAALLREERR